MTKRPLKRKRTQKRQEYERDYKRRQREQALRDGLCFRCCKNRSKPGIRHCQACLDELKKLLT